MSHDWQSFDWQNARYDQGDLTPGDPYEVATLGKQMRDTANMITAQVANLRNLVNGEGWDSNAGEEFRKKVEDAADNLQKVHARYDEAATALGGSVRSVDAKSDMTWKSGTEWASTLELAQVKTKDALRRGSTAHSDSASTQKQIDAATAANAGQPDTSPAAVRMADQKTSSDGDLNQAGQDIDNAISLRDREGKAVAGAINHVINHDGLRDPHGFWNAVGDVVAAVGHIAGAISAVCGVLALICSVIPGLQVLGALFATISLITGIVALGCDLVSALDGKGTWLDVGIDALGVLSFGAGRVLGEGAKGAAIMAKAGKASTVLDDAASLESAGAKSTDAFAMAKDLNGSSLTKSQAMLDRAAGRSDDLKNLPGWGATFNGWKGARTAPGALDLAGAFKGGGFTLKSGAQGLAWAGSQTVPLALGWGNLAQGSSDSGWRGWDSGAGWKPITGQNWFDPIKTGSKWGANGIPGYNGQWNPDGGWHASEG